LAALWSEEAGRLDPIRPASQSQRRAAPLRLRAVSDEQRTTINGSEGEVSVRVWDNPAASRIVVIAHGYGEHIGRYEHVADALVQRGAVVYGPDHLGHGRSDGEQVVVTDFERVVDDLQRVVELAREQHPGLPVALIGHSMGGLIATRYAQRHGGELAGMVLSGPAVGLAPVIQGWLAEPELPADPIDLAVLSRDPAVGEAYAADPLVWHGGWKRPTLEAFVKADEAIAAGLGFGALPVYYVHGQADELVPLMLAQPVVQRLRGDDFTERVVPEARHEVFNETDRDETIGAVADFVDRVTQR
jgi:alpha-beta hydrolase superfamily lysophospholipase